MTRKLGGNQAYCRVSIMPELPTHLVQELNVVTVRVHFLNIRNTYLLQSNVFEMDEKNRDVLVVVVVVAALSS